MNKILSKFKNIHFLWLVGVICFLTFYIPVAYFTTYTAYIPEWTLPIFIFCTMIPLWFHEFLWRTSRIGSDSYNGFHDLHFEDKKWKTLTCNPFYFLRKYFKWLRRKIIFWMASSLLIISLCFGYIAGFEEFDFHPFMPFHVMNSIWWIGIIKDYVIFKNDAREGLINYKLPNF
jgi:hypothetical protein